MNWQAIYTDGTTLSQFEGDIEHSAREIDQSRLSKFVIFEGERIILAENGLEGATFLFRQRHFQTGNEPDQKKTIWIVGVQRGVDSSHVAVVAVDQHLEIYPNFSDSVPYLWPPELHDGEEWRS